nr:PREDICTED: uncharacterized protein LOC109038319 isoform X1 [Bemisia tabaci]
MISHAPFQIRSAECFVLFDYVFPCTLGYQCLFHPGSILFSSKAFPFSVLRSLDGLIEDLEPLEVERHEAVVAAMKIQEFKDDQLMSKLLSTWSEFDAGLVQAREVFTEIIGLLKSGQEGQARKLYPNASRLNLRLRVLNKRIAEERKGAPSALTETPEYRRIESASRVNSRKIFEIVNQMQRGLLPFLIESVKRRKVTLAEFGAYIG